MHSAMRKPILSLAVLLPAVLLAVAAVWPVAGWAVDAAPAESASRLTAEQQQSALDFVKEHHPQLSTLITRLQKRDPAEYHTALKDVFRTCERLQRMEGRDRQRYEVELKLWKVDSRIRLLAARMAADQSPSMESQLRELLNERTDLRLQQLTLERERLNNRIERIDSQVSQLSSERDTMIDREVERLQRSVRARSTRAVKNSAGTSPADAGARDRSEQNTRGEAKPGISGQGRLPERPASKPSS
jgi:hypothetical protein